MKKLLCLLALSLASLSPVHAEPLDALRAQLAYRYLTQVVGVDPVVVANIISHSETVENVEQAIFELTGLVVAIPNL